MRIIHVAYSLTHCEDLMIILSLYMIYVTIILITNFINVINRRYYE